ncbi:MAG: helix-turn-helix domain-containing protein [Bacteroidota bacterium]
MNIFLVGVICILSLYGFKNQLYAVNYSLTNSYKSLFIPISFIMLLGPMIWFYVKSLVQYPFTWKTKYWYHFVPSAFFFLYTSVLLVAPESVKQQFMFSPFEVRFSHLEQILSVTLGLIYSFLSIHMLMSWKGKNPTRNAKLSKWVSRFLYGMVLLLLSWATIVFLNFWMYDFGVATVSYNPLWLIFGLSILWLGIEIFSKPKLFLWNIKRELYRGSKLMNTEDLAVFKDKLDHLMKNQKLYLNTNLSLDLLAEELGISAKQLSATLNKTLGKSFYDLINQYRVNEVKLRLKDPNQRKLTIEAIANQSGYKSKSSFNKAFKKQTGMTPREFVRREM